MALRGLLIALLGKPQRQFCDKIYPRSETIDRPLVARRCNGDLGGSRSLYCSLSRISVASRMHAIRSEAGLLRCTRDNASVRREKNT